MTQGSQLLPQHSPGGGLIGFTSPSAASSKAVSLKGAGRALSRRVRVGEWALASLGVGCGIFVKVFLVFSLSKTLGMEFFFSGVKVLVGRGAGYVYIQYMCYDMESVKVAGLKNKRCPRSRRVFSGSAWKAVPVSCDGPSTCSSCIIRDGTGSQQTYPSHVMSYCNRASFK